MVTLLAGRARTRLPVEHLDDDRKPADGNGSGQVFPRAARQHYFQPPGRHGPHGRRTADECAGEHDVLLERVGRLDLPPPLSGRNGQQHRHGREGHPQYLQLPAGGLDPERTAVRHQRQRYDDEPGPLPAAGLRQHHDPVGAGALLQAHDEHSIELAAGGAGRQRHRLRGRQRPFADRRIGRLVHRPLVVPQSRAELHGRRAVEERRRQAG